MRQQDGWTSVRAKTRRRSRSESSIVIKRERTTFFDSTCSEEFRLRPTASPSSGALTARGFSWATGTRSWNTSSSRRLATGWFRFGSMAAGWSTFTSRLSIGIRTEASDSTTSISAITASAAPGRQRSCTTTSPKVRPEVQFRRAGIGDADDLKASSADLRRSTVTWHLSL
jgi:hypothetical protein